MYKNKHQKLRLFLLCVAIITAAYWLTWLLPKEYRPFADVLQKTEAQTKIETLETKKPSSSIKRLEFYNAVKAIKNLKKSPLKNPETKLKFLKREELVKAICELEKWDAQKPAKKPYSDISKNDGLAPCVFYAKTHDFLSVLKLQKKFLKKNAVKRSEAAKFLKKVYGLTSENKEVKPAADEPNAQKPASEEPEIKPAAEDETPELEEPAAPFVPVAPNFIAKDFFEGVNLASAFPNTFYKNEVYFFEGDINSGAYDQAFVFLMQDGKVIHNFLGTVADNHFVIQAVFLKPGNYQLGLIRGSSGRSKITDISVLAEPEKSAALRENPKPAANLSSKYQNAKTELSWELRDNANLVRIKFLKGKREIVYFFRTPVTRIEPFTDNLAKFSAGEGSWLIETAFGNTIAPAVKLESGWTASETLQKTFVEKGFRTVKDKVTIEKFTESLDKPGAFIFKGSVGKKLAAKGLYTNPNGTVESFFVGKSAAADQIEANTPIDITLNFSEKGVYIFELNDPDGEAAVNAPIYVGEDLLPIIPDFMARQEASLDPALQLDLAKSKNELLALINESRKKAGLSEIILDEKLSETAQKHSDDMVSRSFFGHYNPDKKGPEDRRKTDKYPMPVRENLAKAPTVEYSHEGLMRSPVHRKTILADDVTRVGIGITKNDEGYLLVAEEFSTDPFTEELLEKWKRDFMSEIQQARVHQNLNALNVNEKLEKMALDWSKAMISESFFGFKKESGENLLQNVRDAGINETLKAFVVQGGDRDKLVAELVSHEPLADAKFSSFGLGMAADPLLGAVSITVIYSY